MRDRNYEKVAKFANITNDLGVIVNEVGQGYSELKIASMVGTLARKGMLSKDKAKALLVDYPNIAKFIDIETPKGLKGSIPKGDRNDAPTNYTKPTFKPVVKVVKMPKMTDKEEAVLAIIKAAGKPMTADEINAVAPAISVASARIVLSNLEKKRGMLSLDRQTSKGKTISTYTLIEA